MEPDLNILLVEDEQAHREAIRRAFENEGITVNITNARTLSEVRNIIKSMTPDIALLDLHLSDGRAVEVLTFPPEEGDFPILLMTSHSNEKLAVEAIKAGALDYIVKTPQSLAEMPRSVMRALREWQLLIDRKETKKALQQTKEHLEIAQRIARLGSWEYDISKNEIQWSRETYRIYEFELETPVLFSDILKRVHPEDIQKVKLGQKKLAQGKSLKQEYRIIMPNGDVKTLWELAEPIIDQHGYVVKTSGILQDITERKQVEEALINSVNRLKKLMDGTVAAMGSALEVRDPYTAGHQKRVSKLSCTIAKKLNMNDQVIETIRIAALLHDIGKIYVPAEILSKPGKLTPLEYDMIKVHPQAGYEILSQVEFDGPVSLVVSQHHERLDGSGYPGKLSQDQILPEAKIISIADVVEAMASNRPYRPALGIEAALSEIEKGAGKIYDYDASIACLRLFREENFTFEDEDGHVKQ